MDGWNGWLTAEWMDVWGRKGELIDFGGFEERAGLGLDERVFRNLENLICLETVGTK